MIKNSEKIKILASLRKNIEDNQYPLNYKSDFDFYNKNPKFNCYAYALGLRIPNRYFGLKWEGLSLYNPGTISTFDVVLYDEDPLIKTFLMDCDVLGLDLVNSSISSSIEENAFKVSIYLEENKNSFLRDFHFIRQNIDGKWSHMKSVGGSVEILSNFDIPSYNYLKTYTLKKKK